MRARNIKPDFYTDEGLVECSIAARWLAPGLWMMADREGRLEDKPKKIKMKLAPLENLDIDCLLDELEKTGEHIIRYEAGGCRYIQILNFTKHQAPHCKEKASEIPAPDKHGASTVQAPDKHGAKEVQEQCSHPLIPDSGFLIPDSKDICPDTSKNDVSGQAVEADAGKARADPEFIRLPTNTGEGFPVSRSQVDAWAELYGNVDVEQEVKAIFAWLDARPANQRKTAKGMKKFVVAWLNRSQDKGGNARASPPQNGNGKSEARRKAWEALPQDMKRQYAKQYAGVLDDHEKQAYLH